jgi:hypothetical protein
VSGVLHAGVLIVWEPDWQFLFACKAAAAAHTAAALSPLTPAGCRLQDHMSRVTPSTDVDSSSSSRQQGGRCCNHLAGAIRLHLCPPSPPPPTSTDHDVEAAALLVIPINWRRLVSSNGFRVGSLGCPNTFFLEGGSTVQVTPPSRPCCRCLFYAADVLVPPVHRRLQELVRSPGVPHSGI